MGGLSIRSIPSIQSIPSIGRQGREALCPRPFGLFYAAMASWRRWMRPRLFSISRSRASISFSRAR